MPGKRFSHPRLAAGTYSRALASRAPAAGDVRRDAHRVHQRRARTGQVLHAAEHLVLLRRRRQQQRSATAPCTPSAPRRCSPSRAPAAACPARSAIRRSPPAAASRPRTWCSARLAARSRAVGCSMYCTRSNARGALPFNWCSKSSRYCTFGQRSLKSSE